MARKVLLADGSPEVHKVVYSILGSQKFKVFAFSGGNKVLNEAPNISPDVILLDSDLPQGDGYEICRRIKEDAELSKIPVIILSAEGKQFEASRFREVGANGYITKPLRGKDLVRKVHALVNLSHMGDVEIEKADMGTFDFVEEVEILDAQELEGGLDVLERTDEMEPLETAVEQQGSAESPESAQEMEAHEIEKDSSREKLEHLELGDLEVELIDADFPFTEDIRTGGQSGMSNELEKTQEVENDLDLEEEFPHEEGGLSPELELLSSSEEKASNMIGSDETQSSWASGMSSEDLEGTNQETPTEDRTSLMDTHEQGIQKEEFTAAADLIETPRESGDEAASAMLEEVGPDSVSAQDELPVNLELPEIPLDSTPTMVKWLSSKKQKIEELRQIRDKLSFVIFALSAKDKHNLAFSKDEAGGCKDILEQVSNDLLS